MSPAPLWRGRVLALAGIALVGLTLRFAVTSVSPITAEISVDVPLGDATLGVLGALAPVLFAMAALLSRRVLATVRLETALVMAASLMVVGHAVRALAVESAVFLVGSALAITGAGFGNVLLPPAVKRYFPDRIALMTTIYTTLLALGVGLPAIVAAPVANAAGWRVSLASWAIVALIAALPWLAVRARSSSVVSSSIAPLAGVWRSGTVWAIAVTSATMALHAYVAFAWLPRILVQTAGVGAVEAGALLGLYGLVGIPLSFGVPLLAARFESAWGLILVAVACWVLGYVGLLVVPTWQTWAWVVLIAGGQVLFPLTLFLVNARTRDPRASAAVSSFTQTVGYLVGAAGPMVVGAMFASTDSAVAPLVFLLVTSVVPLAAAFVLARKHIVEDELSHVSRVSREG